MRHTNHGYIPSREVGNVPNNEIWTTTGAYPPPNYDHIDESSSPINPPPSYNAALLLNYQIKEEQNKQMNINNGNNFENNSNIRNIKEEEIVLYRPSQSNNLNQNENMNNTNVLNSIPNNNNDNQINDGEIFILFKQQNQQNKSNKSLDTVTPVINSIKNNENEENKPPI